MDTKVIGSVRHGLILGILVLIMGALWAAYMATHHEELHGGFEAQQAAIQQQEAQRMTKDMDMGGMTEMGHSHESNMPADHHQENASKHDEPNAGHAHKEGGHAHAEGSQHSHSGSLATDAMQRLIRGHIHAMGLGVLVCVLLLVVALTSLKSVWKKTLALTFGLGAVMYPPSWIIMGLRTVELGPEAAEASILWLFGPAVGLLIGSMVALLCVLLIEQLGLHRKSLFAWAFD